MSSARSKEDIEAEAQAKENLRSALSRVGGVLKTADLSLWEFTKQEASDVTRKEKARDLQATLTKELQVIGTDIDFDKQIASAKRAIEAIAQCKRDIYGDGTLKKESGPISWVRQKIKKSKDAYVSIKDIFMTVEKENLPRVMESIDQANNQRKHYAAPAVEVLTAASPVMEAPPLLSTLYPSRDKLPTKVAEEKQSDIRTDRYRIE